MSITIHNQSHLVILQAGHLVHRTSQKTRELRELSKVGLSKEQTSSILAMSVDLRTAAEIVDTSFRSTELRDLNVGANIEGGTDFTFCL